LQDIAGHSIQFEAGFAPSSSPRFRSIFRFGDRFLGKLNGSAPDNSGAEPFFREKKRNFPVDFYNL
jgi:hypothetical protein